MSTFFHIFPRKYIPRAIQNYLWLYSSPSELRYLMFLLCYFGIWDFRGNATLSSNKKNVHFGCRIFSIVFRESTALELSKTLWDFIVGLRSSDILCFEKNLEWPPPSFKVFNRTAITPLRGAVIPICPVADFKRISDESNLLIYNKIPTGESFIKGNS